LPRCLNEDFDLVFCDLMMPDVTGMEFYKMLSESRPELVDKIVFITGGALLDDVRRFLSTVPNTCLDKPVSNQRIREIVGNRLAAQRSV